MKFSLRLVSPEQSLTFQKRLNKAGFTCKVYALTAWQIAQPIKHPNNCLPDQVYDLSEHYPTFLETLALIEQSTWPTHERHFAIIMPKPRLASPWSIATQAMLNRRDIRGIEFIEQGWLLVANEPLVQSTQDMRQHWERCATLSIENVYQTVEAWEHAYQTHLPILPMQAPYSQHETMAQQLSQAYDVAFDAVALAQIRQMEDVLGRPLHTGEWLSVALRQPHDTQATTLPTVLAHYPYVDPSDRQFTTSDRRMGAHSITSLTPLAADFGLQLPKSLTQTHGQLVSDAMTTKPMGSSLGLLTQDLCLPNLPKPWEPEGCSEAPVGITLKHALVHTAHLSVTTGIPMLGGFLRTHQATWLDQQAYAWRSSQGMGVVDAKLAPSAGLLLVLFGEPSQRSGCKTQNKLTYRRIDGCRQRQCQAVIDRTILSHETHPIAGVYALGKGGLASHLPHLLHGWQLGAALTLDEVARIPHQLSSLDLWCNETEYRYLMVVPQQCWAHVLDQLNRERCPHSVLGALSEVQNLKVTLTSRQETLMDLPLSLLNPMLGTPNSVSSTPATQTPIEWPGRLNYSAMAYRVCKPLALQTKAYF